VLSIAVAVIAGLVGAWVLLVVVLLVAKPPGAVAGDALHVLPDTVRLVWRLARDQETPRRARVALWFLAGYLVFPIDLVPDFLPVIGYADDAIIVAFVLRSVVRRAGIPAVRAHWPGTEDGFAAVARLTGLHRAADRPAPAADPQPRRPRTGSP